MLKRNGWLKRGKPPKKKRGARRGPWRNEKKRRYIASLPCLISGQPAQCCHVAKGGQSMKCGDEWTVPLTPALHDELDGRVKLPNGEYGNKRMEDGRYRFEHWYQVDLIEEAIQRHLDWMEEQKRNGRHTDHPSGEAGFPIAS